jgi:hypothetical protein
MNEGMSGLSARTTHKKHPGGGLQIGCGRVYKMSALVFDSSRSKQGHAYDDSDGAGNDMDTARYRTPNRTHIRGWDRHREARSLSESVVSQPADRNG